MATKYGRLATANEHHMTLPSASDARHKVYHVSHEADKVVFESIIIDLKNSK